MRPGYGAHAGSDRTVFRVRAPLAGQVALCLFDQDRETRLPMRRDGDDWTVEIAQDLAGSHYGYRADGPWNPEAGLWFDPAKLLVDPYAVEIDRRFIQHLNLAVYGLDTADIVPRAVIPGPLPELPLAPPRFQPGGLIYEVNVRAFTRLHPDVPEAIRGTVAALAHPAILAHLHKIGVSAVELMPLVAWIDERHLPPLGLVNGWGYNPVAPMALDPGLCPGGVRELRETVAALHAAGIGVILDIVLNHTGESDMAGGSFCLRGLDPQVYARSPDGALINDTGCGNTLDFAFPPVRELARETLRHFVRHCGIDGFRFDLAPVLARGPGFDPAAPFLAALADDPLLADRVLIAEPWDIGAGGYQLGNFPANWLEWNDQFRDDVRRFWRGDGALGVLATRLAGSSDIFDSQCRSVNFIAAHDGFTLADTVSYAQRHNHANGEDNRDGHGAEVSWNCGVEGPGEDRGLRACRARDQRALRACRARDQRALLATLFASTGTIMLTAGDEFGRSQRGNNNAYCQDNAISWLDWEGRDTALEDFVAGLAAMRASAPASFTGTGADLVWTRLDGEPMNQEDWADPTTPGFVMTQRGAHPRSVTIDRLARSVILRTG